MKETREVYLTERACSGDLWAYGLEDYAALCGMELEEFLKAVKEEEVDPVDLESVFWFWLQRVRTGQYKRRWKADRDEFIPEKRTTAKIPIGGELRSFSIAAKVEDLRTWERPTKPERTPKEKRVRTTVRVARGHQIELKAEEVIVSGFDTYYVRYRLFKLGLLWDAERLVWHCPIADWEFIDDEVREVLSWAERANKRKQEALEQRRKDGDWLE